MIAKRGRGKEQWLTVAVKEGKLVISVGVDTLAFAAQMHYDGLAAESSKDCEGKADFSIERAAEFAESVRRSLEKEEEDGTTLVHRCLDAAFDWLIDHDSPEGIEERQTIPSGWQSKNDRSE